MLTYPLSPLYPYSRSVGASLALRADPLLTTTAWRGLYDDDCYLRARNLEAKCALRSAELAARSADLEAVAISRRTEALALERERIYANERAFAYAARTADINAAAKAAELDYRAGVAAREAALLGVSPLARGWWPTTPARAASSVYYDPIAPIPRWRGGYYY
jgi:hypothetical protein